MSVYRAWVFPHHRYERAAIQQWYKRHKVSAATGYTIRTRALRPCNTLRGEIQAWLAANPAIAQRLPDMARAQFVPSCVCCMCAALLSLV